MHLQYLLKVISVKRSPSSRLLNSLCSKAPCHACLAPGLLCPTFPNFPVTLGKSQLCARPGLSQHLLLNVSYKKPPEELTLNPKRKVWFWGFFGGVSVCAFGVCVCVCVPVCVPFPQLQSSFCIIASPRKSAIVQLDSLFVVQFSCNYSKSQGTESEILGANVCWRLFRNLN